MAQGGIKCEQAVRWVVQGGAACWRAHFAGLICRVDEMRLPTGCEGLRGEGTRGACPPRGWWWGFVVAMHTCLNGVSLFSEGSAVLG